MCVCVLLFMYLCGPPVNYLLARFRARIWRSLMQLCLCSYISIYIYVYVNGCAYVYVYMYTYIYIYNSYPFVTFPKTAHIFRNHQWIPQVHHRRISQTICQEPLRGTPILLLKSNIFLGSTCFNETHGRHCKPPNLKPL